MPSFKFLAGAVSGLFGGLLIGNKNLRKKLSEAEDSKEAAKILGDEIQKTGKELAKEAKEWAKSEPVQSKMKDVKEYAGEQANQFKKDATEMATKTVGKMKVKAGDAVTRIKEGCCKKGDCKESE